MTSSKGRWASRRTRALLRHVPPGPIPARAGRSNPRAHPPKTLQNDAHERLYKYDGSRPEGSDAHTQGGKGEMDSATRPHGHRGSAQCSSRTGKRGLKGNGP